MQVAYVKGKISSLAATFGADSRRMGKFEIA